MTRASIALLCFALACGGAAEPAGPAEISAAELLARTRAGDAPHILDVRSPEEFATGHVPGAINVPHDQLGTRLSELGLGRDEEVVLYCERGGRAARVAQALEQSGYMMLRHLTGDMAGWRAEGLPIR